MRSCTRCSTCSAARCRTSATPSSAGRMGLFAEELFGIEGFSGAGEPPVSPHSTDSDARRREGPRRLARAVTRRGRRRAPASARQHEGPGAVRRRYHRPRAALLQLGRHVRRRAAGAGHGPVLPQRRGGRDVLRPHRHGDARDDLRADRLRSRRLPRPADRDDVPAAAVLGDQRMLWVESPSAIVPPKRYRNDFGQLLEHSPYCERWISAPPAEMTANLETGDLVIEVKTRGRITAYHYRHHPFDLVGWDGRLGRSPSTSATSSRSPGASTSHRPST